MFQIFLYAALAPALAAASVDQAPGPQQPLVQPEAPALAADSQPSAVATPASLKLAALTGVELRVVDDLTSKTAVTGMPVQLRLSRPVYVTEELGIPAGTPVEGVVIHAAKGGMGGKSGELLIGAKRIVLSDTVSVPLRSFKLGPAKGQDNETVAFATAVAVGLPALLINGGSAKVPAGSVANAKTQADVEIPVALLSALPPTQPILVAPAPVPAPATQSSSTTQGESK